MASPPPPATSANTIPPPHRLRLPPSIVHPKTCVCLALKNSLPPDTPCNSHPPLRTPSRPPLTSGMTLPDSALPALASFSDSVMEAEARGTPADSALASEPALPSSSSLEAVGSGAPLTLALRLSRKSWEKLGTAAPGAVCGEEGGGGSRGEDMRVKMGNNGHGGARGCAIEGKEEGGEER